MKYFVYLLIIASGISCNAFGEKANKNNELIDFTNDGGSIASEHNDSPAGEDISKIIDNDTYSKFLTFHNKVWIKYASRSKFVLKNYTITSANDAPERDPHSWTLRVSNDGINWESLDNKTGQFYGNRNETKQYNLPNNAAAYKYYKFNLNNTSGGILQIAEIELYGVYDPNDKSPISGFSSNENEVFENGIVQFENNSRNATSFQWKFEGGSPSKSTEENPAISYPVYGKYSVALEAKSAEGTDTLTKKHHIKVLRFENWEDFNAPTVHFENETSNGDGALYNQLIPNPEKFIADVCMDVVKTLYKSTDEINPISTIYYTVKQSETLSAKSGAPPVIYISFSSNYLKSLESSMQNQELYNEIKGVLIHEITHGYQNEPKGAGNYASGTDFFTFLEGIADAVRIKKGYTSYSYRKAGGHWTDGYKTTAFFIDWLSTKDKDFLYKFNKTGNIIAPWSWNKATEHILEEGVQNLWDEYQQFLNNEITHAKNIEQENDKIEISPCPFKEQFILESDLIGCFYSVINISGVGVKKQEINSSQIIVNMDNMPSGSYVVSITDGNKRFSKKIVKE